MNRFLIAVMAAVCVGAFAQDKGAAPALPSVTISAKANRDPVEKSYRRMVRGMDLFERRHSLAPQASLRFKLLPRRPSTDMSHVEIDVLGSTVALPVTVAADHTFTLERNAQALQENAQVTPNRASGSMTWRTEIRTPGLPPNTRRLGDLRLECEVGMEAGLVSNANTLISRVFSALSDTPAYCYRKETLYLFFAERPLFSVTLSAGARREVLAIDKLYAAASDDPGLKQDLPFCDCEVLLDRTYFLPLGDAGWPDDTLVEFDYMDDGAPGTKTRADLIAALGKASTIAFDSGYEVWLYRVKGTEVVVLLAPDGVVKKSRVRAPDGSS